MFSLLKKRYHPSNIYSIEALTDVLNSLDNIYYYHVTSETFFDFNVMLSKCYKPFPVGSIKQNHFFVDDSNPTTMCSVLTHDNEDADVNTFDHTIHMQDRQSFIRAALDDVTPLPAPGMKPIKQVELWKKWGPFVPEAARHHLCRRPPDDVINQVALDRSLRQQQRVRARNNNNSVTNQSQRKMTRCNGNNNNNGNTATT